MQLLLCCWNEWPPEPLSSAVHQAQSITVAALLSNHKVLILVSCFFSVLSHCSYAAHLMQHPILSPRSPSSPLFSLFKAVFPVCQHHSNNSALPFRSAPGGSIAPVALSLPSLFSMPISATSVPDNYDLVGARGADGVVGAWGGRGGGRVSGGGVVVWWEKKGGRWGWGFLLLDC